MKNWKNIIIRREKIKKNIKKIFQKEKRHIEKKLNRTQNGVWKKSLQKIFKKRKKQKKKYGQNYYKKLKLE